MSRRFRICLAAWIAVVALSAISRHASAQVQELTPVPEVTAPPAPQPIEPVSDEDWVIDIRPARPAVSQPAAAVAPSGETSRLATYSEIYNSIPFNRALYNANPTYRHDTAMEILTGNSRHQTFVTHTTARPAPVSGAAYRARGPIIDPLNPARYGYLRPALRLDYYRHFPSLNPYVNIRNYTGAF